MNKSICEVDGDGNKFWVFHNKLHREDGPAIEYADDTIEYWIDDYRHCKKDYYKELVKRGIMTYEEAVLEML